jgi:exopolysaccharide biosynthesis polyprenyl glycosylphosphotransferase
MKKKFAAPVAFLFAGDVVLLFISLNLSFALRSHFAPAADTSLFNFARTRPVLLFSILAIYIFSFYVFDLYNLKTEASPSQLGSSFLGVLLLSSALIMIHFWLFPFRFGRSTFLMNLGFMSVLLGFWRFFAFRRIIRRIPPKSILLIGTPEEETLLGSLLQKRLDYKIAVFIKFGKNISDLNPADLGPAIENAARGNSVDLVVMNIDALRAKDIQTVLFRVRLHGIPIIDLSLFLEETMKKIPLSHITQRRFFRNDEFPGIRKDFSEKLKRSLDVIMSCILLLLSLPLLLLVAALIKLTSRGPVFFHQERLGRGEYPYRLWKFRTMVPGAEPAGPQWADEDDARITRVGRILRKIRLDELPQLVNVLKGEMSLVGPRPEREYFVRRLSVRIPFYELRFYVKPGITGWAQINYRYGSSVEDATEKLMYDLFYIKNRSTWLDLKILIKTLRVIFLGMGR